MSENDLDELRQSARGMLARHNGIDKVRSRLEDPTQGDDELWAAMVEMGWPAIAIEEAYGGAGAGAAEMGVVLEELGRALAPVTLVASGFLAPVALRACPGDRAGALLTSIAAGEMCASVAFAGASGAVGLDEIAVSATPHGIGWALDGEATFVPGGQRSDVLLVVARLDSGEPLLAVLTADEAGCRADLMIDTTRWFSTLALRHVTVDAASILATGRTAERAVEDIADGAALAIACDSLGIIDRAIEITTQYVRERIQFGRPIGTFQAVKHRMADMVVRAETTRVAVADACQRFDRRTEDASGAGTAASMAKAHAADAANWVASEMVQLHGGIGYTWEHDAHLFLKRAKLNQVLFGDSRAHRRRVADAVLA